LIVAFFVPLLLLAAKHARFHQVKGLNQYIEDHRHIPTYKGGNKIKVPVIQWYLSRNIEEWVALGGERLLDKGQYLAGIHRNKNFKREFYKNLW
jgi:hypothetical protein